MNCSDMIFRSTEDAGVWVPVTSAEPPAASPSSPFASSGRMSSKLRHPRANRNHLRVRREGKKKKNIGGLVSVLHSMEVLPIGLYFFRDGSEKHVEVSEPTD